MMKKHACLVLRFNIMFNFLNVYLWNLIKNSLRRPARL
jgi:hypothetical protein